MSDLPSDPMADGGIRGYGLRLRSGSARAEAAVQAYIRRIESLDARLGAFEYVDAEGALSAARRIDQLLDSGRDLGPLMGVPVAVKDIFAVDGMPVTAGSKVEVVDLIGGEGGFVRRLREAGCIVVGKTKTVEFALGAVGISKPRGTPWNPWDSDIHRIPGGSSSGSAVAVAAGLCGFAIGTDTGGSVRIPAALCGIFGLKYTVGTVVLDGVFPLHPDLDSIGFLARSAGDAAVLHGTLIGGAPVKAAPLRELVLGRPNGYFFDGMDESVTASIDEAVRQITDAGALVQPFPIPEASEREAYFPVALPLRLLDSLGRDRFMRNRDHMDSVVASRVDRILSVSSESYRALEEKRRTSVDVVGSRLAGFDGLVTPTVKMPAVRVVDFEDTRSSMRLALSITQNSQPANYFGFCATTTPIKPVDGRLPIGLQLMCRPRSERCLLSIALALEQLFGVPPSPDLSGFVA